MIPTSIAYLAGAVALRGPRALARRAAPAVVVAGLGMFGAYALALARSSARRRRRSPRCASRASSSRPRLAAVVLGERVDGARWAGAVLVVAGVGAIALAG